jgi:hypothetical protein
MPPYAESEGHILCVTRVQSAPKRSKSDLTTIVSVIAACGERPIRNETVAPAHVHDPMTMLLRENAIQTNLMRWDDVRGRYVLTGTGRRRTVEGSRVPGTVVSFRKRSSVGSGPLHRKSTNTNLKE